jgi:hypothetical protein
MIRPVLILSVVVLLAACSNRQRRVHIVTHYNKQSVSSGGDAQRISLSDPGVYTRVQELELDAANLVVSDGSRSRSYHITEPGQYVINFDSDTLLSNPAEYIREPDYGGPYPHFENPRIDPKNWKPSGNATADSMMTRLARAQAANEKLEREKRKESGRSEAQTIYPDSLARISGNTSAYLFILSKAPERIEGKAPYEVEYYEINTFRYWKDRIQRELDEELRKRSNPYGYGR